MFKIVKELEMCENLLAVLYTPAFVKELEMCENLLAVLYTPAR
jgi:hypothetical protein